MKRVSFVRPLMFVLLVTGGCASPSAPVQAQTLEGRYALASIDTKVLPYLAFAFPNLPDTIRIVADTLTLRANGTFSIRTIWTGERFPGTSMMSPHEGTWRLDGTVIRLSDNELAPTEWLRGPIPGPKGLLRLTHNAGNLLVYQRVP